MKIPRFKEKSIGYCPSMSSSEYEECVRSIERKNNVKRTLNAILDLIDKPDEKELDDCGEKELDSCEV